MSEFSKKTGDYPSLSATDIKVLALTCQLETEFVGAGHLRKEPIQKVSDLVVSIYFTGFFIVEKATVIRCPWLYNRTFHCVGKLILISCFNSPRAEFFIIEEGFYI